MTDYTNLGHAHNRIGKEEQERFRKLMHAQLRRWQAQGIEVSFIPKPVQIVGDK